MAGEEGVHFIYPLVHLVVEEAIFFSLLTPIENEPTGNVSVYLGFQSFLSCWIYMLSSNIAVIIVALYVFEIAKH